MAFSTTIISAAVGESPHGKAAPNKESDVKKVQGLLRKVLGGACPAFREGVFDSATKGAIEKFQREWGGFADGVIGPTGDTLKRLNRLANPLVLKPITREKLNSRYENNRMIADRGGYSISYSTGDGGPLPAKSNYSVYLAVGGEENVIDVTKLPAKQLIDKQTLPQLLAILDDEDLWRTTVECTLQVRYSDFLISTSESQDLEAPVEPHNGRLVPLDEVNNGPKLTYQGDPRPFHGRMFVEVPGYPKPLFVYGGLLETDLQYRGFDCITYVGTACGGSNLHMAESPDMASHLGASSVTASITTMDAKTKKPVVESKVLDYANPEDVRQFFSATSMGYFIMWKGDAHPGTHVVLVVDGTVHEFNRKGAIDGYGKTEVLDWIDRNKEKKLTVRRLPTRPARSLGLTPLMGPAMAADGWA
jgi:hypothetical protein